MPLKKVPTVREQAETIEALDPHCKAYVLLAGTDDKRIEGIGETTRPVGVGRTYEEMWDHAGGLLGMDKAEMRKHGYVFDHVPIKEALEYIPA